MSEEAQPKSRLSGTSPGGSLRSLGKLLKMGSLSRKSPSPKSLEQGQGWHRAPIPDSFNANSLPAVTWEPGMFTLDYITRNLTLPRLIQCEHSSCDKGSGSHGFDCTQPLLLYSKKVGLKVAAGGLAVASSDGKTLVETDNRLLVSEDYKGWFAVLGTDMTQRAVPHYRHVAHLAQSDCHTFLIGGTENVKTIHKVGDLVTESRDLCPGDILKMGVLEEGGEYLRCTDNTDRDVVLPIQSSGTFFILQYKTRATKTPIQQIKDIVNTRMLPCIVQLVHGRMPTDAGIFTKLMVLEDVGEHISLLTSSMLKPKNVLYELPIGIPNKFKVAVFKRNIFQSSGYINALNLCLDSGDRFMRGIRLYKHDEGALNMINRVSLMGMHLSSLFDDSQDTTPTEKEIRQLSEPAQTPAFPAQISNGVNGISDQLGVIAEEQCSTNTGNGTVGISNRDEDLLHGIAKSRSPRPHAYDEIWSTVSPARLSDTSNMSLSFIEEGLGGQVVTGGISNPQSALTKARPTLQFHPPSPDVSTPTAINSPEGDEPSKIMNSPTPISLAEGPFNTSIDIVKGLDDSLTESPSTPSTPDSEKSFRRKTVSFKDEVDVHSIPQQHVTTINVHESPSETGPIHSQAANRMLPPIPADNDTNNNNNRRVVSFEDFTFDSDTSQEELTKEMRSPDNGEDEMGYMLPVFDRKGRVHSKSQKQPSKEVDGKTDASRRLSLPNLKVTGAYNSLEEKKKSEADILY